MSRFLTPTKIGLLALITLYVDSVVPASATISVLSFITKHILRKRSPDEQQTWDTSPAISIEDLQKTTSSHASAIPGRTLWDLLLNKIWSIDSFDALHVFFDSLSILLATVKDDQQGSDGTDADPSLIVMKLSRNSPLGVFVRRSQLEFTRLPLHDGISLWRSFIMYRKPTLSMWRRRNPSAYKANFEPTIQETFGKAAEKILYDDLSVDPTVRGKAVASAEDAERILEFQIDQMQKMGQRVTTGMKEKLEDMFHAGSSVSSLSYYVMFLDAWKGGDYTAAFDNLHRYFDYTMQIQGRTFYQYALVNMAIMQADFGCYGEAMSAMQESIAMARENRDMGCLNFCLSWLYHFSTLHPEERQESNRTTVLGNDRETLFFIKTKAKESGMWSLLTTTLLGEAGLGLSNGDSVSQAFESLSKSAYLNNAKNVSIAYGNQMVVESSLYSRLGLHYMQWTRGEIFLECYSRRSLSEDTMKLACMRAMALSRRGKSQQAIQILNDVEHTTLRTLRYQQGWVVCAEILRLQHALRRDELSAAQHYLSQLKASPPKEQSIGVAISLLNVDLLSRMGELPAAMEMVDKHIGAMATMPTDIHAKIKFMILKARIYDESGLPQKGFSFALRAASIAFRSRVLDVLWEAVVALCRVLCSLAEYAGAIQLMHGALPQVLEVEDYELVGASFSCLADAHMGLAGHVASGGIKRKEHMTKALEYLERAFDEFSRAEDAVRQREIMAKRATIMHTMEEPVLANDYASKYLAIDLPDERREP